MLMNPLYLLHNRLLLRVVWLVCTLAQARAQFVTVTASVEVTYWDRQAAASYLCNVQCVVGTNSWQMDGDFSSNSQTTYWFTGTNIIEHSTVNKIVPEGAPIGAEVNQVCESVDGNPGMLSACGPNGSCTVLRGKGFVRVWTTRWRLCARYTNAVRCGVY